MNLVSPQQLSAMADSGSAEYRSKLHDEIAKIAFSAMAVELGTNFTPTPENVQVASKSAAKISFDFADAFMRERYERSCVRRAGVNLDDLGKLK